MRSKAAVSRAHVVAPLVELVVPQRVLDDHPDLRVDPLGRLEDAVAARAATSARRGSPPTCRPRPGTSRRRSSPSSRAGRVARRAGAVGEPEVVDHDLVEEPGRELELAAQPLLVGPVGETGDPLPAGRGLAEAGGRDAAGDLEAGRPEAVAGVAQQPRVAPGSRRGTTRRRPWSRRFAGTRRCASSIPRSVASRSRTSWAVNSVENRCTACLDVAVAGFPGSSARAAPPATSQTQTAAFARNRAARVAHLDPPRRGRGGDTPPSGPGCGLRRDESRPSPPTPTHPGREPPRLTPPSTIMRRRHWSSVALRPQCGSRVPRAAHPVTCS